MNVILPIFPQSEAEAKKGTIQQSSLPLLKIARRGTVGHLRTTYARAAHVSGH